MKSLARALLLVVIAFAVATAMTAVRPGAQKNSPYASALSLTGIQEAQAAKHPLGPGCQRTCTTTGCVFIANQPSSCYAGTESCIEEPCQ